MGLFARMSTTVTPGRLRASAGDPFDDKYYVPQGWLGGLTAAGVRVSPDLALTLSAVWRAVSLIAGDISTLPCQIFKRLDDGGKQRARNHPLSYPLRWQPNKAQTAQQFFAMGVSHQLLRGNAYAEIVPGPRGFADQLVPRHPDRVIPERLPDGTKRYRLLRGNTDGTDRILTDDEMMHAPDLLSFDGIKGASRIEYGVQSFGAMLAAESASQKFFKSGMTASLMVTHKGTQEMDEEELRKTHAALTLYQGGVQNNGGILFLEEDMTAQQLGIDPEKAQLLATRKHGIQDVARWFGIPGHKLETDQQTQAYAARAQANIEYVVGCLRPILVGWEQVIQKDVILAKDTYFAEFLIEALLRGDEAARAAYYTAAIRNRWMNPNEVRLRENLNPYAGGEEYCPWNTASAADNGSAARSGKSDGPPQDEARRVGGGVSAGVRASLLAFETGQRIARKEIAAVTKLAKQHANDPEAWKAGLQSFYQEHAGFIAETLHVSLPAARDYVAEHGLALAQQGIGIMESWPETVAHELAAWALEGERAA